MSLATNIAVGPAHYTYLRLKCKNRSRQVTLNYSNRCTRLDAAARTLGFWRAEPYASEHVVSALNLSANLYRLPHGDTPYRSGKCSSCRIQSIFDPRLAYRLLDQIYFMHKVVKHWNHDVDMQYSGRAAALRWYEHRRLHLATT